MFCRDESFQGVVKIYKDPELKERIGSFSERRTFIRARSYASKAGSRANLSAEILGTVVFNDFDQSQVKYSGVSKFKNLPYTHDDVEHEFAILGGTGHFLGAGGVAIFREGSDDGHYYYSSKDYYYGSKAGAGSSFFDAKIIEIRLCRLV